MTPFLVADKGKPKEQPILGGPSLRNLQCCTQATISLRSPQPCSRGGSRATRISHSSVGCVGRKGKATICVFANQVQDLRLRMEGNGIMAAGILTPNTSLPEHKSEGFHYPKLPGIYTHTPLYTNIWQLSNSSPSYINSNEAEAKEGFRHGTKYFCYSCQVKLPWS